MRAIGRYDTELQMFVDEPRELNREKLMFLRWLADQKYFWDDADPFFAVYTAVPYLPRGDK